MMLQITEMLLLQKTVGRLAGKWEYPQLTQLTFSDGKLCIVVEVNLMMLCYMMFNAGYYFYLVTYICTYL